MDNIYDIRKKRQLQFVLSEEISSFVPAEEFLQSCAVVVHLYYVEKVEYYCTFLNALPEGIMLYLFSSREDTLAQARRHCHHENTWFLEKENRGRDLSAFLVAFRPYIERYTLICFLHDKKERRPCGKKDADKWNENLWGNMIATREYVYNVLQLFQRNADLGMLLPPEPLGEYKTAWYRNVWEDANFYNCVRLAEVLGMSADISRTRPPIALGSVFWARPAAVEKLWMRGWKYEDFPGEPMPDDYTISHAVERILGYATQDAGYETATVMTQGYASWSLLFLQDYVRKIFLELEKRTGIENFHQLRIFDVDEDRIKDYIRCHESFFLYGAGKFGVILSNLLREAGTEPAGFVVSDGRRCSETVNGLRVYELSELSFEKAGIILAAEYPLWGEMADELERRGIRDYVALFENAR